MKLIIAAAGTGGHIIPGLNIALYLQQQKTSAHGIHWIGTRRGMENQLIPPHHIPMHPIDFLGVRKKGLLHWLLLPLSLFKATLQVHAILRSIQPDIVLVMGGYVSVPTAMAAYLNGIPLIVHEQNAMVGLANKFCSLFANKVCYAFEKSFKTNQKKFIHTGNPIDAALVAQAKKKKYSPAIKNNQFHILVLGGSLGAQTINTIIPEALYTLQQATHHTFSITHQCGHHHLQITQQHYQKHHLEAQVIEFSPSLPTLYARADLIIARAGAMSVAEISTIGCPALFIPYPHAVNDHQYHNAKSLIDHSSCIKQKSYYAIIRDRLLTIETAFASLYMLYQHVQKDGIMPNNTPSKHISATQSIVCIMQQTIKHSKERRY